MSLEGISFPCVTVFHLPSPLCLSSIARYFVSFHYRPNGIAPTTHREELDVR